jgi:peptidase M1-like protein
MKKIAICPLIIIMLGFSHTLLAQSKIHTPLEFQKAYKNGTRSMDGKPGEKYWQNFADYTMEVNITPETRAIVGKSKVIYTNNSPDQLNSVVIRLYYDVFKIGNKRESVVNVEDIGDGVNLQSVKVNGQPYDLDEPQLVQRRGTNLTLRLMEPLGANEKLTLEFAWEQKVPLTIDRTGAIDSTSFFVAYWYPQVSVYDDIFGWDRIDFTLKTEFYNNLANFDVKITVPDNFLVWATGTFQNADEVLPKNILQRYTLAKTAKDIVHVVTTEDLDELKMLSTTWHYTAHEVSDFAFAMSDHYLWDATSQEVDGRDVLIATAFPVARADQFTEVTSIQQQTMKHFSEDIPGIPYPYEAFTTFIGLRGGGMEFPMMANNDGPSRGVTIHEMFHTYFPMYVRINERRFAWMDEGWATFNTALVTDKFFTKEEERGSFYANFSVSMQGMVGSIGDLPTATSTEYTGNNYGYQSYPLPAFTYSLLYNHLGEEKFLACYRGYIRRWAKKSPTPYDYFYTFEDISGEDLSWLWNSWYFGYGYPDIVLESLDKNKLTVKRIGARPVPVSMVVEYNNEDGAEEISPYTSTVSAAVWKDGEDTYTATIPNWKRVKSIVVNTDMPDVTPVNNFYPPLPSWYNNLDVSDQILGNYPVDQYPVTINIIKEDELIKMTIPGAGIEEYLLPVTNNQFTTLDKMMVMEFNEEDGKIVGLNLGVKSQGLNITAKKQQ